MKKFALVVWFSAVCVFTSVKAQSTSTEVVDVAPQSVEINSVKDPDWKSYSVMLKGLDAFEKYHTLAPDAVAKFVLKPRKAELNLEGLRLRLASDEYTRAIPILADGSFVLPRDEMALQQNAELMLNRGKNLYRWWPRVETPGLNTNHRRLGDLRLECEMFWAIHYDDLPFFARNAVRLLGGPCRTKKITFSFPAQLRDLEFAELVDGEKRIILPVDSEKSTYTLSLLNPDFSDNAMIELRYARKNAELKRNDHGLDVQLKW
ncbi:hypothetical protein [Undibacterium fentianense]|uniref:Uncharacterized protein n=1 Tax=Undibacterium fentianense TaxID=2828728 RepID=A0A941IH96_9BURK|nr:hypothetical protein [Undibacterium fentianense]MBR7800760.1 hypothetical protein [Undibacterium fentianense]